MANNNSLVINLVSSEDSSTDETDQQMSEVSTEVDTSGSVKHNTTRTESIFKSCITENDDSAEEMDNFGHNCDNEDSELSDDLLDESSDEDLSIQKKKPKISAEFGGAVKGNNGTALYGIQFNPYLPDGRNVFAVVGGDRVTLYECPPYGQSIRLIDCFSDSNMFVRKDIIKQKENFFSVCWSYDDLTGNALVICGGARAVIRVIDCVTKEGGHLLGHGGPINDLKVSPHDHNLLLSSSEDHSLRLWNLKTSVCVAKFSGESGHRDQVICADFYCISDHFFVSCGMDHSIKIWSLNTEDIRSAIKESYEPEVDDKSFPMRWIHYPVFSTRNVHTNYIDCVQFFGRFIVSKSIDNRIVLTQPALLDKSSSAGPKGLSEDITKIGSLKMEDNEYWFVKFSMDFNRNLLSIGNHKGVTYLWDLEVDNPFEYEPLLLKHRKSRSAIRQIGFNTDGNILISVSDDLTIWRWNVTKD